MTKQTSRTLACLALSIAAAATTAGQRRVLIIGVDGLRPDCIAPAITPNIDALIADGCFNANAQNEDLTFSGPNWSTILHGVHRDKHQVITNSYDPTNLAEWPDVFTYLERHNPDWVTARFNTWGAIYEHQPTGADIDRFHEYGDGGDEIMLAQAVKLLAGDDPDAPNGPDAMFFYIADTDSAGHAHGFDPSRQAYLDEIADADAQIGALMDAIRSRSTYADEDWLVILTSDHGGDIHGGHAGNTIEKRTIPFLVSGTHAFKGTAFPPPKNVDTLTTTLAYMGVPIDPAWNLDGRVVGLAPSAPPVAALDTNLIFNPGGDYDRGFNDSLPDQSITAWRDLGPNMMTVIRYGAGENWPTTQTPGPTDRGNNFFAGGLAPISELTQIIDLGALSDDIASGRVAFTLSGWLGGFANQDDRAALRVEFLDSSGQTIGSATIGPVTAADRDWKTSLLHRVAAGTVPGDAVAARVTLRCDRLSGSANDGYADSLSLVLNR